MTEKEAVKIIQGDIDTAFLNGLPFPIELRLAISALEKRIPQKAVEGYLGTMYCPCCGYIVRSEDFDIGGIVIEEDEFCPNCGQHILVEGNDDESGSD